MEESKLTHWGAALIIGVCTILGGLGGALFQREREQRVVLQDSAPMATLRRQLEECHEQIQDLNSRLAARDQTIESLRHELQSRQAPACPPCAETNTSNSGATSPPSSSNILPQTSGGLLVKLDHCLATGSKVECGFQVTNLRDDRRIKLWAGEGGSRMIDQDGLEIPARVAGIGSGRRAMWSTDELAKDVPTHASLVFENVPTVASKLELLQVNFDENNSVFGVKFKGIAIER